MGMFSRNRTTLGNYDGSEIVADESYSGELGVLRIQMEAEQNDHDIFMACLEGDFNETAGLLSGTITESQIIEEASGAVSGFISKIKELIKKLWAKLKGLFETFIKKINSVIIRDNKKFVDKYKRDVLTKDLSKMKFKWEKPTNENVFESSIQDAEEFIDGVIDAIVKENVSNFNKIETELSDGTFEDDAYGDIIKGSDAKSYAKEYHSAMFEDMEEQEGLSNNELQSIMEILSNKKLISNLEKNKKDIDKVFSKYLANIDKKCNSVAKSAPGDASGTVDVQRDPNNKKSDQTLVYAGKDARDNTMRRLALIQRAVSKSQSIYSNLCSCEIRETKFLISQCRRVFAKAVSYNPKRSANENAIFMEAAADAAGWDVESLFEDYSME